MKVQIVISSMQTFTRTTQEWKRIADSGNEKDGGAVYEYVPCTQEQSEARQIFSQEVELDSIKPIIASILENSK